MPFSTTLKLGDVLDFSQAAQDAPQQIESGDFNGDGKLDFLITRAKGEGAVAAGFRLMMGQGNGQWLDQTTAMFGGVVPTVTYTASVIVADFNGDGRSDVYVPDFGFHGPSNTGGHDQVWLSSAAGGLRVASVTATGRLAHGATSGDIDRDGDIDVMVNNVDTPATGPRSDLVLINTGGSFSDTQALLPPSLRTDNPARLSHTASLLADLNGDGALDLVLGTWPAATTTTPNFSPPSQVLFNNGSGSFAASAVYTLPQSPVTPEAVIDIDAVDLNGDGLNDLVMAITRGGDGSTGPYSGTGYIQILMNRGGGQFVDETAGRYAAQVANAPGSWWKYVRVADFNKDGAPDLLLTGAGMGAFLYNQAARVLLNDGTGRFTETLTVPISRGMGDATTLADVNADGYADLVTLQWASAGALSLVALVNDYGPVQRRGTAGNDSLEGGAGIDTAVFSGARAGYTLARGNAATTLTSSAEGSDTLSSIERLKFSDMSVALDLTGNAGITAKTLGAVFGPEGLANRQYVGIGLQLLDAGISYAALLQAALAARLGAGASNTSVVNLLYTNVIGSAPGTADLALYKGLLDSGAMTQAALGVLAADTAFNTTRINLTGLAGTGIEYL